MIKTMLPRLLFFFKKSSTNYTQLPLDDRWRSLLHGTTSKKQLARHLLPLHLLTKASLEGTISSSRPTTICIPPSFTSLHLTSPSAVQFLARPTHTHTLSLSFSLVTTHPSIHWISCLRTFPALKAKAKAKAKEKEKFHRVIDVIKWEKTKKKNNWIN